MLVASFKYSINLSKFIFLFLFVPFFAPFFRSSFISLALIRHRPSIFRCGWPIALCQEAHSLLALSFWEVKGVSHQRHTYCRYLWIESFGEAFNTPDNLDVQNKKNKGLNCTICVGYLNKERLYLCSTRDRFATNTSLYYIVCIWGCNEVSTVDNTVMDGITRLLNCVSAFQNISGWNKIVSVVLLSSTLMYRNKMPWHIHNYCNRQFRTTRWYGDMNGIDLIKPGMHERLWIASPVIKIINKRLFERQRLWQEGSDP